ncbi:MAG: NAD(P)H-binding protein [Leptospirales bacterium]|nr:NAD(P)H-binding protein [Leptospirales bacterium]
MLTSEARFLWSMNILVIGASQGTGALAVAAALERGHRVTAFARTPQRLKMEHPNLRLLSGDFHDAAAVAGAVPGHDAIIITASATSMQAFKDNPNYFSMGTAHVIDALKKDRSVRLIVLSALGVGESRKLMNWLLQKLILSFLLRLPFADHERQEALVKASGLKWVIARPGRLTDGPSRKSYQKKTAIEPLPSSISRADVADFLVQACESDAWIGQAVQLGG